MCGSFVVFCCFKLLVCWYVRLLIGLCIWGPTCLANLRFVPFFFVLQAAPRGGQRLNLEKEIGSFNVPELGRDGDNGWERAQVLDPNLGTLENQENVR